MNDICVPIPHFTDNEIAEVEVRIGEKKSSFNFRVESFSWETSTVERKINQLKNDIEGYDKNWELVQIFTPSQNSKFIHVLFRQRKLVPQD